MDDGMTQVLSQIKHPILVTADIFLGTPISTITKLAKEEEVDFILMGSRGNNKSRIDRMFGSFSAGVVERATTPVIVIPEKATFKPVNSIAYASDLLDTDPFRNLEFNFHTPSGLSVQKELDHFIEENQPEMMIMYQPHHSFWDKLLFKSYPEERTVLTQIPLLVQKAR